MIKLSKKGIKYGKSSEKALTMQELEHLRLKLEDRKERVILIGLAFAGMRIEEFIQCRKEWLQWDVLQNQDKKRRVLAIKIPNETRHITNKYFMWRPKTKMARTTYILDESLAETFMGFYIDNPDGISAQYKSKNVLSIARNISQYVIGTKFLKELHKYHEQEFECLKLNQDEMKEKIIKTRPKLSAHPLRSSFENILFYHYQISIDVCASILGHSEEIAKQHYISKTQSNIKSKLGMELIK